MLIVMWVYSIVAILVFLGLVFVRNSDNGKIEYDNDYRIQSFLSLYGERVLFFAIAIFWPIVIFSIKNVKFGKSNEE